MSEGNTTTVENKGKGFESVRPVTSPEAVEEFRSDPPDADVEAPSSDNAAEVGQDRRSIAALALHRAADAAGDPDLFERSTQFVVVVRVPSADWVKPLAGLLAQGPQRKVISRPTEIRRDNNPDYENDFVANQIIAGRTVIGLAVDPAGTLPRTLVATADVTLAIAAPDADLVKAILAARFPGAPPPEIPDSAVVGLDIGDIAAAMRGASGLEVVCLLARASARRAATQRALPAPDLRSASEYGEAQAFGLSLVQDISDFRKGIISWEDMAKGACFYGEPGCGKKVLADSIAAAAAVPLLKFSIGEFFGDNSHLGTVIQRQRDMFASALAAASPCSILFIDEIEALPRKDQLDSRGRDWWLPIINDFLLMSEAGNSARRGVIILAATNVIDMVEPAMLRPGRLERAIEIGRPDLPGTINILRFHLKSDFTDDDITDVARIAQGSTAAELADLVRTARRRARRDGRKLQLQDLLEAILGEDDATPEAIRRFAIHEAGHAVAAIVTGAGTLSHVSLRNRARSAGETCIAPRDDDVPTLESIERNVVTLLTAGAAEKALIGMLSVGSGGSDASDLANATRMLATAHASTGVTGLLFHHASTDDALEAARRNPALRSAIERHLQQLDERAAKLVERHRDRISAVADALVQHRFLSADGVVEIVSRIPQNDERSDPGEAAAPSPGASLAFDRQLPINR